MLGGLAAGSVASLLGGMGVVSLSHPPVVFAAEEGVAEASAAATAAAAATSSQAEGAILITGANSGVGFAAAKQLAAQGKRIVLACRSEVGTPCPCTEQPNEAVAIRRPSNRGVAN